MWSLPQTASMLRRLLSSQRDSALQTLQLLGLERAAQLAATTLRRPHQVDNPTFAPWHIDVLQSIQHRLCDYSQTPADDGRPALPPPDTFPALETSLTFIQNMPDTTQLKLKHVLALIEAGPRLLGPDRRKTFSTLTSAQQDAYLHMWEQHPVVPMRAAFHGLKSVAMMGYWTQPQVWPSIDYSLETEAEQEAE